MKQYRTRATLAIKRSGSPLTVLRKTGGTDNGLGKTEGATWEPVGTATGTFDFNNGGSSQNLFVDAGEHDQSTPGLFLPHSTLVQDGDRVVDNGIEYEILTLVTRPTHKVAKTVTVDE